MRSSTAGALIVILGILIMVAAVAVGFWFADGGWEITGSVVLFLIGLFSAMGGSELIT